MLLTILELLLTNAPCAVVIFDNSAGHYCNLVEVVGM